MSNRIEIPHRIIAAVGVQVHAADAFGIKVGHFVGRKETADGGVIIAGVQVVQVKIFELRRMEQKKNRFYLVERIKIL